MKSTTSVKDRVKTLQKTLKLSQEEFGKRIYVSQRLLTGKGDMRIICCYNLKNY
jgi:DNA-binding transcriptional regulator YiaG